MKLEKIQNLCDLVENIDWIMKLMTINLFFRLDNQISHVASAFWMQLVMQFLLYFFLR